VCSECCKDKTMMHLEVALTALLSCSIGLATAEDPKSPEIGFITDDVVTNIGGDAELICTVRNNPADNPYPVSWMRLGGANPLTLSSGSELTMKDPRMKMEYDSKLSQYSLSISNVRKSDATRYQCQVVIDADHIVTRDTKIHVKLEPVIVSHSTSSGRSVRVVEGAPADLVCNATGYPVPTIDWSREDGSLMPNGKSSLTDAKFHIEKTKRQDRGIYKCSAHNNVGTSQNRSLSLEVEFSPEVKVPRPMVPQAEGYEATLECEVEAYPPPSILWKKNGKEVTNINGSFYVTHFAKQDEKIVSTVKIHEVTEYAYGVYECQALNRHGKDSKTIEVYRSEMPICPPLCGDANLDSGSFIIKPAFSSFLWTVFFGLVITQVVGKS